MNNGIGYTEIFAYLYDLTCTINSVNDDNYIEC